MFEFSLTSIANKTHESRTSLDEISEFNKRQRVSTSKFLFSFSVKYKKKCLPDITISAYSLEQKFIFSEFWFRRVHIGGSDD